MSEIFSAIRLKDRIIIAVVMAAYALMLTGSAGAVTYASVNNHVHDYSDYHLEMTEDGEFNFVGVCSRANCKDPRYVRPVLGGITEETVADPTCSADGTKEYYFYYDSNGDGKSEEFIFIENIPAISHLYECEIVTENGVTAVIGSCVNEGCTNPTLNIAGALDLKVESSVQGTCTTPRKDNYTYTVDGVSGSFTAAVTVENAPHVLGGVPVTEYEISNGVYMFGTEGIIPVNGSPEYIGCGQKIAGYYVCEGCNQAVGVILGLPDHVYSAEDGSLKEASFEQTGQITVKCGNKNCTDTKKITLPKADETNATLISTDEVNKKQTWQYSYYSEKYNYTVEFTFESDWVHDHVFVHDPSLTEAPSLDLAGKAIVKCSVEGCSERRQIVLPKIQIDDNAVLIVPEPTELQAKTVRYTYVSEKYGFTEVLEIAIGKPLTHAYKYYLEPYNGGFTLFGRCDQPECQKPEFISEENVETTYVNTSTCNTFGEQIWSYTKNGDTYTFTLPSFELLDHNLKCEDEDIITKPTFTSAGKAVAKCTNAGCSETFEFTLPKVVTGENADIVEIDNVNGTQTVKYTYTYVADEREIVVEMEFVVNEAHSHDYQYELEPNEGQFDLVGRCTSSACAEEIREKNVPAVLIKDTVSCTDPGYQTWSYVKNGEVYNCNIINFEAEGHFMHYNPEAATTVNPTFDAPGSIVVFCNNCDTQTRTVDLPACDKATNTTWLEDTKYEVAYLYTFTTEDGINIMLILKFSK